MSPQTTLPERWGREEYRRLLALQEERRYDELYHRGLLLLEACDTGLLTRARTHSLLCWVLAEGWRRPSPEALFHGDEAMRIAEKVGEAALKAATLFHFASAAWQLDELPKAEAAYQEVRAALHRKADLIPYGLVLAYQGLAQVALLQGSPQEALRHLAAAEAECPRRAGSLRAEMRRRRALALLQAGEARAAAAELAQVDEAAYARGPRDRWWRLHLLYTRACVAVALARWPAARGLSASALALAQELEDLSIAAEAQSLLALVEQAEGRRGAPQRARLAVTLAIRSGRRDVLTAVRTRLQPLLALEG